MNKLEKEAGTLFSRSSKVEETDTSKQANHWSKVPERVKDLGRTALALGISCILYVVCIKIMDGMPFWLKHSISLIIALMTLWAVDSITKTKPIIGTALVIFLFVIFFVNISRHYFIPGNKKEEVKIEEIVYAAPMVKDYYPGDKPYFKLGPNQETGWLNVPSNSFTLCTFYTNSDFLFLPESEDPIFVKKGSNPKLPNKKFKLKATNQEAVIEFDVQ